MFRPLRSEFSLSQDSARACAVRLKFTPKIDVSVFFVSIFVVDMEQVSTVIPCAGEENRMVSFLRESV